MTNPLPGKIISDIIPGRRRKRLHLITGEEALTHWGNDLAAIADVFLAASGNAEWEYARWLDVDYRKDGRIESHTCEESYCVRCVEDAASKKKAEYEARGCADVEIMVDGWDEDFEVGSPRWCHECGVILCHSLTKYGVETELMEHDVEPVSGSTAAILANLAGGIGDLWEEHHGKLAQIALATWWQREHGNWAENPLVTIVGPNQLTPREREEAERLSAEFEADVARGAAKGLDPKGDV